MCDVDLKTCQKSSKFKKKDIVELGKQCGVNPYLSNGKEKSRTVICTEIVASYNPPPGSSQGDDSEHESISQVNNIPNRNEKFLPKSKYPTYTQVLNMEKRQLKALAKKLGLEYKKQTEQQLQGAINLKIKTLEGLNSSTRSRSPSVRSRCRSPSPRAPSVRSRLPSTRSRCRSPSPRAPSTRSRSPSVRSRCRSPSPRAPSVRSRSPSRQSVRQSSESADEAEQVALETMKTAHLRMLATTLGASTVTGMKKKDLIDYIKSRRKSPSPSPVPPSTRCDPTTTAPPMEDLFKKKVDELKTMAKNAGFVRWNGKTLSKMNKSDLVDFLLNGMNRPSPSLPQSRSRTRSPPPPPRSRSPSVGSPSVRDGGAGRRRLPELTRAQLTAMKVVDLKAMATELGLTRYRGMNRTQMRKGDVINFIIETQKKQKTPSPSPTPPSPVPSVVGSRRPKSPLPYKSRDFVALADDDSEPGVEVQKKMGKSGEREPKSVPNVRIIPSEIPAPTEGSLRSRLSTQQQTQQSVVYEDPNESIKPEESVRAPKLSVVDPQLSRKTLKPLPSLVVTDQPSKQPELPKYKGRTPYTDLEQLAQSKGYTVKQVSGDGNCLFRSVCKSIRALRGEKFTHRQLRQMVVDYLRENPEFLQVYLEYVARQRDNSLPSTEQYLSEMSKCGTWGDLICLKTLSEILKVQFNLLILNTKQFQMVSSQDDYPDVIPLGYIDNYHYTSLVPIGLDSKGGAASSTTTGLKQLDGPRPPITLIPESQVPAVAATISTQQPPSIVAPPISVGGSQLVPSIVPQPQMPKPDFKPVKPLSNLNELLDLMDRVKPQVYNDISQLEKARQSIKVSLGL
ncbi:hypothetical protein MIV084L [Invertebrate iridescent virus 3]|uniref:Putative ubiquitin thioesterase 232R n=1 Tax=Invertebrate iridescent virus 3 TaxID=345201 RepID=VF232_IIV3|nr:hypothetical protein MIV084L [Invertebrate iridescent virus 3]Q196X6.1 RecName: Full=Putative ubiquitin thioesterase 232R [Invertebrate iridescent virus 3]ABF82114.1 hypothetical protein MIV084L [Invertebrate iridescent virus 3]